MKEVIEQIERLEIKLEDLQVQLVSSVTGMSSASVLRQIEVVQNRLDELRDELSGDKYDEYA